MKDLYDIMDRLLDVESDLNNLKATMQVMESGCREQQLEESTEILNVIDVYLNYVMGKMRQDIHLLDEYLAVNQGDRANSGAPQI
ncbi:MAG: hypothetical protein LUF92_09790 [Clostridiales bacterium]|nr:hypothetical protein [Clostridiales bacterium]